MNTGTYTPNGRVNEIMIFTNELKNISGYEKYIYVNLARHAYKKDFCFVGQQTLARISSSSLRTVQRCLSKLESVGLIRIELHGRQKRYYLTIPSEFKELAAKYGLISSTPNKELEPAPGEQAEPDTPVLHNTNSGICDNLSPVGRESLPEHDNFSVTHDNLSPINKDQENYNNSPLPPQKIRPGGFYKKRFGGAGSFIPADLKSRIAEDFKTLQAAYPRQEDMREALDVFIFEHSSLPPIGELVSLIEYEKSHNEQWQRQNGRYVPYLKNWLKFRQFEAVQVFIQAEAERRALVAVADPALCSDAVPGEQPEQPLGPEQPFIEADFEACAGLWGLSGAVRSAARAYWQNILLLGILPKLENALATRARFDSMAAWLKHFKQEEYSQINQGSNTNFDGMSCQVACAAA